MKHELLCRRLQHDEFSFRVNDGKVRDTNIELRNAWEIFGVEHGAGLRKIAYERAVN